MNLTKSSSFTHLLQQLLSHTFFGLQHFWTSQNFTLSVENLPCEHFCYRESCSSEVPWSILASNKATMLSQNNLLHHISCRLVIIRVLTGTASGLCCMDCMSGKTFTASPMESQKFHLFLSSKISVFLLCGEHTKYITPFRIGMDR